MICPIRNTQRAIANVVIAVCNASLANEEDLNDFLTLDQAQCIGSDCAWWLDANDKPPGWGRCGIAVTRSFRDPSLPTEDE